MYVGIKMYQIWLYLLFNFFDLLWYLQSKRSPNMYKYNPDIKMSLSVSVCRNSIASATTWRWSSSSPPKWRGEEEEEEEEVKKSGTSFHFPRVSSFAFRLVPTPLCGGRSVAPILRPYEWRKRNRLLVRCLQSIQTKGNVQTFNRRSCWECNRGGGVTPFTPLCLLYSFFECQRAPVCFGPHLNVKHLTTAPLPWTWCFTLLQLQYSMCTVDVSLPHFASCNHSFWITASSSFQWPHIPALI